MSPFNITMCQFDLPPGPGAGVAHQVSRLSTVLQRRGHRVTVLTTEPPTCQNFAIRRLAVPKAATRSKAVRFVATPLGVALASYAGQDIVHCHGDSQLLWRRAIPTVRTFYGTARDESRHAVSRRRRVTQAALAPMELLAKRLATVTVGISHATEATLGKLDLVIPCGVDRDLFVPGAKSRNPSVLFVGTVGGRKRGHLLLEQFARVVKDLVPSVELWMVCSDRPTRAIDGVKWFTKVEDAELASLFRRAWVFCLPSSYEGFGVPYIEALASGTVVLATPNAGANEILHDAVGGAVVDERELGQRLAELLLDEPRRLRMEFHARKESGRYSWEVIAGEYERAYEGAVDRKARTGKRPPSDAA